MNTFPTIPIVYEDAHLLVINKPAGVVVNRSQTTDAPVLQDWIEQRAHYQPFASLAKGDVLDDDVEDVDPEFPYGTPEHIFVQRSGIAHRLDKDTSGVLLIAKHPEALMQLLQQFQNRTVHKTYTALVHGKFPTVDGEINLPIGRNSKYRLQFAVTERGRESVTDYHVERYYAHLNLEKLLSDRTQAQKDAFATARGATRSANFKKATKRYQGFSFVTVFPKTGRTHQIRVHMAHLNHPLVGDAVYSGKKRQVLDAVWCPRHFLHASSLRCAHPDTGAPLELFAPLAADLAQALSYLTD